MDISLRTLQAPGEPAWRPHIRKQKFSLDSEERSHYSSNSSEQYQEPYRSRNRDRAQPSKPILRQQTIYPSSPGNRDRRSYTSAAQDTRKRHDRSRARPHRTPPPSKSYRQTRRQKSRYDERHRSRRRDKSLDNETTDSIILALQKFKEKRKKGYESRNRSKQWRIWFAP